jgi:glycosyltransferase involved in cell wall biosynthesis
MKILKICFRLGSGGPGIYVPNLAHSLRDRGHEVAILTNGTYDFFFFPRLDRTQLNGGILHYQLANSPNFHTGLAPIGPMSDVSQPKIERLFRSVLEDFRPDIIHIHDLGGFCLSMMKIAAAYAPVVNSLHSYALLCQQNHLINRGTRQACQGPGGRCISCMGWSARKQRRFYISNLLARVRRFWDTRVVAALGLKARHFKLRDAYESKQEVQWSEVARRRLAHEYEERTRIAIELMSESVSINLAVSEAVARIYTGFGLPVDRVIVQHIGTKAAEEFSPLPLQVGRPVKIGYVGSLVFIKGAELVIEAFNLLPKDLQIKLILFGYGNPVLIEQLKAKTDGVSVEFRGPYSHADLPAIMREVDAVVIPPVWEDNAPQTVFEALALGRPVIGARIGGIPDFVRHEDNGLLFEARNAGALAQEFIKLASDPPLAERLAARIKPMKRMGEHAVELEALYLRILAGGRNARIRDEV